MKNGFVTLLTSVLLLVSAPSIAQDQVLDRIVAVVNGGVVLESDIATESAFLAAESRANGTQLPAPDVLRERVVERLIDQTIQRQQAARLGIAADASSVNRALAQVARGNNMSTQQFREALIQQGFDYNHFRKSVEQQIITERLVQREVQARVRVSEQEIDDFLKTAENNAAQQSRFRLQHILVAVPPSANAEAIEAANQKADDILNSLQNGNDFATLAAAQSDGSRALQGGDLGWRQRQELPGFIQTALETMDVDDIRGPLRSPNGLHIIKLAEKQVGNGPAQQETRARHIFLAGNDANLSERLATAKSRIDSGEAFGDVAAEISEDPNSSTIGGELPWYTQGQLPEILEQTAARLEIGVVSAPFQTQFGWHIVEVLERRERSLTSASARTEAEAALRQRKVEQEAERWIRQLRDESFVELRNP